MERMIIKEIEKMEGTFLGIGIENKKIVDTIKKRPFLEVMFLEGQSYYSKNVKPRKKLFKKRHSDDAESGFFGKLFEFHGKETANIKKLRKSFKKKTIDNIVCNYEYIKKYTKHFIKDSVYLNKGTLIIYGEKEDISEFVTKYKRYTDKIEVTEKKDKFLVKIDNGDSKNNKIKDIFYFIYDTISGIANVIADILIG